MIGVDPGQKGALCLVQGATVEIVDMPATIDQLLLLLRMWRLGYGASRAVLELVHSMPQQGVASTFKFGRGFGQVEACLIACGYEVLYVRPEVWKPAFGLTSEKKLSSQLCQKLFGFKPRRNDHAEARLLAEYGRRFMTWSNHGKTTCRDV